MKSWFTAALLLAALGIGLLAPSMQASRASVLYENQVAVLMYHHLDETAKSSSTITPQLFRDQLKTLQKKQIHFITLDEFKKFINGTAAVPANAALVTFDDGYKSFYTKAYPILRELNIPAVNFVITGDLEHPEQTYIPSMSREEIRLMLSVAPQLISIGCHTDAMHDKLPSGQAKLVGRAQQNGVPETDEAYRQRILADTKACLTKLNELSPEPVDTMAYPFGITNDEATRLVGQAGIRYAFTITPEMTTADTDKLRIPRINGGSPDITPDGLYKTILHRIVRVDEQNPVIVLGTAFEQLGGSATQSGNELKLSYHGEHWTARIDSNRVIRDNDGSVITLKRPIVIRSGQPVIGWNDLQAVLGPGIAYSPQTGRVTPRVVK